MVDADPPPVGDAVRGWFTAGITDLCATLLPPIREHGTAAINEVFDSYLAMSEVLDRDDYITTFGYRTRLMREWNLFLHEHPLLLCPFLMRPTFDWDYDARGPEEVKDLFDAAAYSTGINYLGLPAGVIGTGIVEERPAGVQIVGARYREDLICDALEAVETRNGVMAHWLWDRDGD